MQRYNARHQQQNRQQEQQAYDDERLEHDEQGQEKQKTPALFCSTTSSSSDNNVVITESTPLKDLNHQYRGGGNYSSADDNNKKKALEITNNNNNGSNDDDNKRKNGNNNKKNNKADDDASSKKEEDNNNAASTSTLSQKAKEEWDRLSEHVLSGAVLLRSSIVAGRNLTHPLLPQSAEIADLERQAQDTSSDAPNRLDPQMHSTERRKLSRDQKREEYQEAIRNSMDFSLGQCLLAIAVYVGVAVIAYSYVFERWSVIDSMYFAVITFTTIGYGDLAPTTAAGKVFTAFFALSGVACLGIALGELGSNLIEAEQTAMRQARKMSEKSALTLFENNNDNNNNTSEEQQAETTPHNNDGELQHEQQQHPDHPQHHQHHHGEQYMPPPQQPHAMTHSAIVTGLRETGVVVLIVAIFAFIMNVDPNLDFGWDLGTTLYFAIITSCTVGYGDIAPTSQVGRFVAVLLIPAAVGAMGHWLSVVAGAIIDRRQAKFRELWKAHQLTQEDLEVMDHDGDGNVTRAEFLEFMLVATDVLDQETVDELRAVFDGLDADGTGSLSREDLIVNAKRKCASPERKLEMARYKQQLLEQAESARKERRQRSSSTRHLLQGSIFGSMMSIGSNLSGGTSSTRNLSGGTTSTRNLRRFSSSRDGASQNK